MVRGEFFFTLAIVRDGENCSMYLRVFLWLAGAAVLAGGSFARANVVNWIGGQDFNWTTAPNWSGDALPGAGDDVVLGNSTAGFYTVNLAAGVQNINSLTTAGNSSLDINGGTLSAAGSSEIDSTFTLSTGALTGNGNVTATQTFFWDGGAMSGAGTTTIASGANIYIAPNTSSQSVNLDRTLDTNGETNWINGAVDINNSTFNNTGIFLTLNTSPVNFFSDGGSSTFNNSGFFFVADTGTIVFYAINGSSFTFNNSGVVRVASGTLAFNISGTNTGSFQIDPSCNLIFNSSFVFGPNAQLTGAGTFSFSSGTTNFPAGTFTPTGTVNFIGGNITINNAFSPTSLGAISGGVTFNDTLEYSGGLSISGDVSFAHPQNFSALNLQGTLNGTANITISGSMTWTGGIMTGTGTTIISSGTSPNAATLNINATTVNLDRTLENDGSANWTGGTIKASNGIINNNGTFIASSAGTLACFSVGGTNVFNNAGSFNQQGTGVTQFYVSTLGSAMTFNNTGTVDVSAGILQLSGTISQLTNPILTGGTWNIYNNATLLITSGMNIASIGSAANVRLDGANSVFANINSLIDNEGTFTITNGRNFTPASAFTNTGGLVIGPGSTFEATAPLINLGAINLAGGTLKLDEGLASGTVLSQLQIGYNNGEWNGTGIASSLAAADPNHATGIGYIRTGTSYTLVTTWLGDTDLNGVVNAADLQNMAPVGTINATWSEGDFNYDGIVNADDYGLYMLGAAYQTSVFILVPEPDFALAAVTPFALLAFRRR
jgi:hypothetical protein